MVLASTGHIDHANTLAQCVEASGETLNNDADALALTTAERLILANQSPILAALFPSRCADYNEKRRTIERGIPTAHANLLAHRISGRTAIPTSPLDRRRASVADRG